ncbi:MAG: transporter substrate-binding domain-containing protein [Woeseiaceae bacterium]
MAIDTLKRQFFSTIRLLCVCLLLTLATGCAGSPETRTKLDAIRSSETLRVGTTGDFVPFSYRRDGSGTLEGVDIAFARKLANELGVHVEFVQTTWPTLMDDLLADKFDIGMSGITITPERLSIAFFSIPIMASGKVAITRDENAERFRTVADINSAGVRVIVNPGGTNESFAREHFPQATIVLNADNLTVFDKIISGAADVMVTDAVEAAVQEIIHPDLEVTNRDAPFNTFEFGLLMPRDYALKNYVDHWIDNQGKDQTYRQLFDAELIMIETRAKDGG